jgi:hypothetical protein
VPYVGCNRQRRITPSKGKSINGETIYLEFKRTKENNGSPRSTFIRRNTPAAIDALRKDYDLPSYETLRFTELRVDAVRKVYALQVVIEILL